MPSLQVGANHLPLADSVDILTIDHAFWIITCNNHVVKEIDRHTSDVWWNVELAMNRTGQSSLSIYRDVWMTVWHLRVVACLVFGRRHGPVVAVQINYQWAKNATSQSTSSTSFRSDGCPREFAVSDYSFVENRASSLLWCSVPPQAWLGISSNLVITACAQQSFYAS